MINALAGDPVAIINSVLAALSIGFGALGFLWPSFALEALKLTTAPGFEDGKSEIRAASGGAFILMGAAGLMFGHLNPLIWVMVGVHYAGAAAGRLLSIAVDGSGSKKIWLFFAIEIVFAAWLIGANLPPI
ncbi:MAG: DUF4345 family protein [Neomegalonema sp.]|nr:DUF4345 family protein [Neomegalonema sp.]